MTPEEYIQLKAFARQDGALLSVLWIGSFLCYLAGLSNGTMGMLAIFLAIASPFFAANRLRHFRDYGLMGFISFRRGYAYSILTFFYAGLLLAAAIYVYFAYFDNGYLVNTFMQVMETSEGKALLQSYGMKSQMDEGLKQMAEMRPIDIALNMLTFNILSGFLIGVPMAATMRKEKI